MLHIILLILKIIGIILAVILGIVVLLLLLTLFVPLRYKATASFPGTLKGAAAEARASLFFHLVSFRAGYKDEAVTWKLRVAWKKWDDGEAGTEDYEAEHAEHDPGEGEPQEPREPQELKSLSDLNNVNETAPEENDAESPPDGIEPDFIPHSRKIPEEEKEASGFSSEPERENVPAQIETKQKKKKKRKWRAFLRAGKKLYQKLLALVERIKCTFRTFCAKIKVLLKKKEVLGNFIENKTHKEAFVRAKKEAFRLLKAVKPRKFKAQIVFGFEDPYLTGKTLAGLSVVYPFIGGCTSITPNFEQEILKGDLYIRGNLRVIYFVIPAIRLLLDKNVRRTYKHIRNLKL